MIFLSGLPRTGSTLLTSILSQNPDIHTEGNSALCQLMWDMKVSCETNARQQLSANSRISTQKDLLSEMPNLYYKNVEKLIIVDKCRSWTLPANMKLIKDYITDKPKVIVMVRPLKEIVKSYLYVNKINNKYISVETLLEEGSDFIMRSLTGVKLAMEENNGEFLFVNYSELIETPQETLKNIYEFCEIPLFNHTFDNIININPENDEEYNIPGLHSIRKTLGYRKIDIELSQEEEEKINQLSLSTD